MNYTIDVKKLNNQFYADYPENLYSELLSKADRPYSCVTLKNNNSFICIPFRSNITRNNAFFFSNTIRSQQTKSGLDYEKIVLITDETKYFDVTPPIVDNDEYVEMIINADKIAEDALKYIERYINHIKGTATLHPREFARRYGFTSLRYFHNELGIE